MQAMTIRSAAVPIFLLFSIVIAAHPAAAHNTAETTVSKSELPGLSGAMTVPGTRPAQASGASVRFTRIARNTKRKVRVAAPRKLGVRTRSTQLNCSNQSHPDCQKTIIGGFKSVSGMD